MTTAAKLAGFAVVLVVVFTLAFGLGRITGSDGQAGGEVHADMENMAR